MEEQIERELVTHNFDMTIYNDNMRPVLVDVISNDEVFKYAYEEIIENIYTIDYNVTQLMRTNNNTVDNIGGTIADNIDMYYSTQLKKPFSIVSFLTERYGRMDYNKLFYEVYFDIIENMRNIILAGYQPYTWDNDKLMLCAPIKSKITHHYTKNIPKEAVKFYNACCKNDGVRDGF